MPSSPNLGIVHLDPSQSNKAATVNEQLDALDVAIAGTLSLSIAGSSPVTLTTTPDGGQAENPILVLTGTLTGDIELIFPPITRCWHVVNNTSGAYIVTCTTGSGAGVVFNPGDERDIRWDGTNMLPMGALQNNGGLPYDLTFFMPGLPVANQTLEFISVRPFTIPANLAGSLGRLGTAATASTVFTIEKNGTPVATVTFAASATVGTLSAQAAISFVVGDILAVVAPGTPDATAYNLMITIMAAR